jgi:Na+-transporting NADH:ubiquinone oxidoreductase subunit NqrD
MTLAGWITMGLCWTFVTGFSVFLIVKTLRKPSHNPEAEHRSDLP